MLRKNVQYHTQPRTMYKQPSLNSYVVHGRGPWFLDPEVEQIKS